MEQDEFDLVQRILHCVADLVFVDWDSFGTKCCNGARIEEILDPLEARLLVTAASAFDDLMADMLDLYDPSIVTVLRGKAKYPPELEIQFKRLYDLLDAMLVDGGRGSWVDACWCMNHPGWPEFVDCVGMIHQIAPV